MIAWSGSIRGLARGHGNRALPNIGSLRQTQPRAPGIIRVPTLPGPPTQSLDLANLQRRSIRVHAPVLAMTSLGAWLLIRMEGRRGLSMTANYSS